MLISTYQKINGAAAEESSEGTKEESLLQLHFYEESLLTAAKNGDTDKIDSLLSQSTLNINFIDKSGYRAIDHAWENKHFIAVLSLLIADSAFPKKFSVEELHGDLKEFVEERNRLHKCALLGDIDSVREAIESCQKRCLESCYKTKLKYFMNQKESLLYAALSNKQYDIYAFLRSNGIDFLNEEEKSILQTLSMEEKRLVAKSMITDFPKLESQHVNYLTWKSKSEGMAENLTRRIRNFYKKLDRTPEISAMLKVAQYSTAKVVFDFDGTQKKTEAGFIYIDAANPKKTENDILGDLAYELTQVAMEVIFKNRSNPYRESDKDSPKHLESIKEHILTYFREIDPNVKEWGKHYYRPSETVMDAIQYYNKKDHHKELIARVPLILAKFENGREWLEGNVPDLLNFYRIRVIPRCRDFVSERQEPKNLIRKINKNLGELCALKNNDMTFKNVDFIKGILSAEGNRKIFLLRSNDGLLAMAKALQRLFGLHYADFSDSYLALNSKVLVNEKNEIVKALNSEACNFLIVRFERGRPRDEVTDCIKIIQGLVQSKPNLIIVYVTDNSTKEFITKEVPNVIEIDDRKTSLLDLTKKCKRKILSGEILFQGTKMKLFDLVGNDEILQGLIGGDIIEDILQRKMAHIENSVWEFTSWDAAYVGEEIAMDTLIYEFKTSDDIFVISKIDCTGKLIAYLQEYLDGLKVAEKLYEEDLIHKSILIGDRLIDHEYVKNFCQENPKKKIYFIEAKDENGKSTFMLQYVYNPNIYLERNFTRNVVHKDRMFEMISNCPSEYFIVSNKNEAYNLSIQDFSKVFITDEHLVPEYFKEFSSNRNRDKSKPIHWFHVEMDHLIWKESIGSIENIRPYIECDDWSKIQEDRLVEELKSKKAVIFSDEPGSGKTTTVNALLRNKSINEEHWIIKINLGYVGHIRGNYMNFPLELLIEDLQNMKGELRKKLTEKLLERAMNPGKKFPKMLLFVFDGFDEIRHKGVKSKFCTFFKYLKHTTDCKIWVTTDKDHQQVLEEALSTFSIKFIPTEKSFMKQFITESFKNQLNLILDAEQRDEIFGTDGKTEKESRIKFYVKKLLKAAENIFEKNLLGVPLLLKLITEISIKKLKCWINNDSEINFERFGRNILEIYEKFIEAKYEIYFDKYNILCKKLDIKNDEEIFYRNLAKSMILNDGIFFKKQTEHTALINLTQFENRNIIFLHSTFREYYFAQSIIDIFKGNIIDDAVFDEKNLSTLLEIFSQPGYFLIRYFVNLLLPTINISFMPEINDGKTMGMILLTAFKEGNYNILNLILSTYPEGLEMCLYKFLFTKNNNDQTLILDLVSNGDAKIFKTIFIALKKLPIKKQRKLILMKNNNQETVLHLAAKLNRQEALEISLEEAERLLSCEDYWQFIFAKTKDYAETAFALAWKENYHEILRILCYLVEQRCLLEMCFSKHLPMLEGPYPNADFNSKPHYIFDKCRLATSCLFSVLTQQKAITSGNDTQEEDLKSNR